jgi:hypothetical protein
MDIDINRIKELITKREEIDQELASMFNGTKERKPQRCSKCGSDQHNARSCPEKGE